MFTNRKLQVKIDSLIKQLENRNKTLEQYAQAYSKLKKENEELKKQNRELKHIKQENEIMKKYYELDVEPSSEIKAKVLTDLRLHDMEYKRLEELIQQRSILQLQQPYYYPIYMYNI